MLLLETQLRSIKHQTQKHQTQHGFEKHWFDWQIKFLSHVMVGAPHDWGHRSSHPYPRLPMPGIDCSLYSYTSQYPRVPRALSKTANIIFCIDQKFLYCNFSKKSELMQPLSHFLNSAKTIKHHLSEVGEGSLKPQKPPEKAPQN